METRELFWTLSTYEVAGFYVVGLAAMAIFAWGIWRHYAKYRRGAPAVGLGGIGAGLRRMLGDLMTHRTLVRRDRYAGYAHAGIFFGFVIAALGTA
ncbi:MAG: Fe-S oxidoreductase, partial [Hyphomicrobiales bacterium]